MFMAEFPTWSTICLQSYRDLVVKANPIHAASQLAKELGYGRMGDAMHGLLVTPRRESLVWLDGL